MDHQVQAQCVHAQIKELFKDLTFAQDQNSIALKQKRKNLMELAAAGTSCRGVFTGSLFQAASVVPVVILLLPVRRLCHCSFGYRSTHARPTHPSIRLKLNFCASHHQCRAKIQLLRSAGARSGPTSAGAEPDWGIGRCHWGGAAVATP